MPGHVLDLGAGDARFATHGDYATYVGYEIDPAKVPAVLPSNATVKIACASTAPNGFDACVGNPPYLRPQWVNPAWREVQISRIRAAHGFTMSRYANLYLYFLVFAVEKTKDDGLAVLVVPADWTARPSGVEVMNWLRRLGCKIDIYRIKDTNRFFSDVLTTETILVIDKTAGTFSVNWWSLDADLKARRSTGRSLDKLLPSEARGASYAFRGLSPGGQDVFVLTEGERLAKGIPRKAVVPAITSLRQLPQQGVQLTDASFTKNYVRAGRRCWLLNTAGVVDPAVLQHLSKAPKAVRQNYTCSVRKPWYKYGMPRAPDIVYASGFNGEEPKFFLNSAGVRVVGGVHGIVLAPGSIGRQVVSKLRSTRFRGKVVVHAKGLEKIEVRQMNAVLRAIA